MRPIRYKVLLAEQLSAADKIAVTAKVATMYTGPEAEQNSFQRVSPTRWKNDNWQYEVLDLLGRVVVLKFKGAEVAQFFKRQIAEVEPLPCDPIPEGILKDPADAWLRTDLLGLSARQVSTRVGKEKRSAEEELRLTEAQLEVKQRLIDTLETELHIAKKLITSHEATIQKLKGRMKTAGVVGPGEKASAPDDLVLPRPVKVPAKHPH